ncbi:kinase-like domain-containing protein [Fimicolochytrium jonesii]|uniref:kinase-like domain-containing protein n=1 Tax=Fimicolochytrium jonesii TaxID=1396493 RepID=UPI0022FEB246|nr:kinase-like domain-containing protein [Fimicolochytrium jonesii]KAI8823695.1 kinase-like domain-containing protein [Fimicolochytrium jonesii]
MAYSPPRSSMRKPSIVERASNAIEQKLSGNGIRRVSTTPASYGASGNTSPSMSQHNLAAGASSASLLSGGDILSMNAEDYEMGDPIGYGSSAVVYTALYKPTNKTVAVKMIDLDMFERNQIDELRREIQIMSLSKHPHLLPVYGSFVHGSKLYIVTPFLSAGSCLDIMKTAFQDGMDETSIATILKQALEGLVYLHKNGLIHRDVKAGNLLIHEDGLVQLADFGVSSSLMDTGERKGIRKTFVGTPCWMAPEVMEQSGYDYKADIWSFGITALELATGHAPFARYPPIKVLMLTLQNDPPTLDRESTKYKYSKIFKDMIDICLVKDPARRPNAEKLLGHAFFKQAAKKRQYLVPALLQNLPPITQRPHNKRGARPESDGAYHKGVSWDFSSVGEEFNDLVRGTDRGNRDTIRTFLSGTSLSDSSSLEQNPGPDETEGGRKGVTFGTPTVITDGAEPVPIAAPGKKSRFTVEGSGSPGASPNTSSAALRVDVGDNESSSQTSQLQQPQQQQSQATNTAGNTGVPNSSSPGPGDTNAAGVGVRKGRFSVNQSNSATAAAPPSATSSATDGWPATSSPVDGRQEAEPAPLERKPSRFAVQNLSTASSANNTPTTPNAPGMPIQQSNSSDSLPRSTSDRRGRFEVTTGDSNSTTPRTATPASLDQLVRQTEVQRQFLQDIVGALQRKGMSLETLGVQVPEGAFTPVNVDLLQQNSATAAAASQQPATQQAPCVVGSQIGAMQVGGVEWLQRENEALRKEMEGLRKDA